MARIDIDAFLADSAAKGKLWWHGTSSGFFEGIKERGLTGEVECRTWDYCEKGIYFDRNPNWSGWIWANNAKQAAAKEGIPGDGYPNGKFSDWFLGTLQDIAESDGLPLSEIERRLGISFDDFLEFEEYVRRQELYQDKLATQRSILLVIDEDDIPANCTRKFNGHWRSGLGSGTERDKCIRDEDGNPLTEYPYGVDKVPGLTDEEQQAAITKIESELLLQNCDIPGNRFYACNLSEAGVFRSMGMMSAEDAVPEALDG